LVRHETTALVVVLTNLQSLGLQSLRSIPHGRIFIGRNSRLCYAETVNWTMITGPGRVNVTKLMANGRNCGTLACAYLTAFNRSSLFVMVAWRHNS